MKPAEKSQNSAPNEDEEFTLFGRILRIWAGTSYAMGVPVALAGFAIVGLLRLLRRLAVFLSANELDPLMDVAVSPLVLASAVLAYRLRCRVRLMYGTLEILFGMLVTGFASRAWLYGAALEDAASLQVIIPLVAGVYICIRGLNNIEDGLWQKPVQPAVTRSQRMWRGTFHRSWMFKDHPNNPDANDVS